jgi:hypothetical protein
VSEALGGFIPFIITVSHYALQTALDIAALGITLFRRASPKHPDLLLDYF